MKRKIALLMACVLLFGTSFSTYATEPGTEVQTEQDGGASGGGGDGEAETGEGSGSTPSQQPEANPSEDGGQGDAGESGGNEEEGGQQGTEGVQPSGNEESTAPEEGSQPDQAQPSEGTQPSESDAPVETTVPSQTEQPDGTAPSEGAQPEGTTAPDGSGQEGTGEGRMPARMADIGQVDVSIGAALILGAPVDFAVTLTDTQGGVQEKFVTLGSDNGDGQEESCSFTGLAAGEYALTVTGESFATYTQKVTVRGRETVKLMTGFLEGFKYAAGEAHPGVMLIGDVNKDGIINEGDRTALMTAIEGGDATGLAADLNRDGKIDLADLEYFTKGYNQSRDIQAKIQSSVPPAAIDSFGYGDTIVEGDLEALLEKDVPVMLKTDDEAPISGENTVGLSFEFDTDLLGDAGIADGLVFKTGKDTPVTSAEVDIAWLDENGQEQHTEFVSAEPIHLTAETNVKAWLDKNGNIVVHLGAQIAVKRVTLNIKGVKNSNNLVEISKVEFVNGMENRIPEPEMDIPQGLDTNVGSARISVSWESCANVTGYEVEIRPVGSDDTGAETVMVVGSALDITSYGGKALVNYQEYQVRVQSVNGTWRSGYSAPVTAIPMPTKKPDKPDGVSAVGKYQSIAVSWKLMKDTISYNLYYRKSSDSEYLKIEGITTNSYTITGLEDMTEYTIYVTGVNELGESGPSLLAAATTTDLYPAVMPKYKMINPLENGKPSSHIVSTAQNGRMESSALDVSAGTAWGTVDQDGASYYVKGSWDDGGFNYMGLKHGLTFEFDQAYKLDTIAFHDVTSQDTGIFYAQVRWWDEAGKEEYITYGRISLQKKRDSGNRLYYVLKLPQPVNAKKIQFGLARYAAQGNQITVSEVYFYHYDTLLEAIMNLYQDDLHTVLREDVTQETIDELRVQVNTEDPVSGELHPDRELLERELETAEAILRAGGLKESVQVHNGISTKDVGRGFGGLNAWQPLGVAAAAQEEIVVYVGHKTKKTGEAANLQLVATQYHAESGGVVAGTAGLKIGANIVTIPKAGSTTGVESGGALYVQYTGNGGENDLYAVRVSGGVQVPKLDLYQLTDSGERLARATAYVEDLDAFVAQMETLHGEVHQNSANGQVAYPYDRTNCILGASDILLDKMMLSLPAEQIRAGLGEGSASERAQKLLQSMQAMEDMMYLFYQHKGLNANAADAKDRIPKGHLNIRYQRMFSGAFMYAAGNHIGIEWGSAPGMVTSVPVASDSEGRYQSGRYFGWGIAHEIGHCINQGEYAIAEITNNYFSVLAQAKDNNSSVRFQYPEVYKKVTSGTKGRAGNVFTQLGMYWQLHLAYDRGYNYKTYANPEEQLANLFFARVDTYARNTAKAPSPGGVALKLEGDKDQILMRLSCAAAGRNILEFFERWGMTPDEGTRAYAAQFEKETRAIYYVSDESRSYSLRGGSSSLGTTGTVEAVGDGVTAVVNANAANQVDITLSSKGIPEGDVLGYEITRCMIEGGRTVKQPVGFSTENTFTDTVHINNRVVWYEVTVIDKYLNRSAVKVLSPVKIEHDGRLDKSFWTVSTKGLTADAPVGEGSDDDPCEPKPEDVAMRLIDGKADTVYTADINGNAEIVIEFNKTLTVSGFQHQAAGGTGGYRIQVLADGVWLDVGNGTFGGDKTVYFHNEKGDYVCTYRATALKLIPDSASGQISMAELEVIGVTSDNVDLKETQEGIPAIGRLSADYRYGTGEADVIPAGSILFTGGFKGNPAYNVVLLYDQDGNNIGGVDAEGNVNAQSIILADVPAAGVIPNVKKGTWIYWIPAGQEVDLSKITKVRAELYRVNDALTNEGQRLVSDSLFVEMPKELPDISLSGGVPQQ